MAKVQPIKSTASIEFLRKQIFEWILERSSWPDGSGGCVDYTFCGCWKERRRNIECSFRCLTSTCSPHLTLGSVTVSTFPESIFEGFEIQAD